MSIIQNSSWKHPANIARKILGSTFPGSDTFSTSHTCYPMYSSIGSEPNNPLGQGLFSVLLYTKCAVMKICAVWMKKLCNKKYWKKKMKQKKAIIIYSIKSMN